MNNAMNSETKRNHVHITGRHITAFREQRGLTIEQLAKVTGYDRQGIARHEEYKDVEVSPALVRALLRAYPAKALVMALNNERTNNERTPIVRDDRRQVKRKQDVIDDAARLRVLRYALRDELPSLAPVFAPLFVRETNEDVTEDVREPIEIAPIVTKIIGRHKYSELRGYAIVALYEAEYAKEPGMSRNEFDRRINYTCDNAFSSPDRPITFRMEQAVRNAFKFTDDDIKRLAAIASAEDVKVYVNSLKQPKRKPNPLNILRIPELDVFLDVVSPLFR